MHGAPNFNTLKSVKTSNYKNFGRSLSRMFGCKG
jgi:hypothetical protein